MLATLCCNCGVNKGLLEYILLSLIIYHYTSIPGYGNTMEA